MHIHTLYLSLTCTHIHIQTCTHTAHRLIDPLHIPYIVPGSSRTDAVRTMPPLKTQRALLRLRPPSTAEHALSEIISGQ
jgi:hypothetical protein